MKAVKKQFWLVPLIMLAISGAALHSRAIDNADAAIAEAASINPASPQLLSASGRVVITLREEGPSGRGTATGIQGARITFTRVSGAGPVPSPVLTDANGNWNQSGFVPFEASGSTSIAIAYRATPSLTGLAFDPAFKTFVATKLDRAIDNLNFEARRDTAVAFGRVTTYGNRPVLGVTVTVPQGGQAQSATTDSLGRWSIILSGTFSTLRATPSFESFRFDPPSRDFTRQSATQLDFKVPDTFNIGGTLKSDEQGTAPPAPHATVSFYLISGTGARPLPIRSDANGNFQQTGFSTGCTYRIEVVTSSGRVCATRDVKGEFNGRINCLQREPPDTFSIRGSLKSDQQGTAPPVPNAFVSFELISRTGARPLPVRSDANGNFQQTGFTTGCTYRIKVVTSSGRVCATRDVTGAFNGRINCL